MIKVSTFRQVSTPIENKNMKEERIDINVGIYREVPEVDAAGNLPLKIVYGQAVRTVTAHARWVTEFPPQYEWIPV